MFTVEDVEDYKRHAENAQRLRIAMGHTLKAYVAREMPDRDPRETLMISAIAFAELVAALLAAFNQDADKNKAFLDLFDSLVMENVKRITTPPDVTH